MRQAYSVSVIACAVLVGCVTSYSEAPRSQSSATVVFKKAYTTGLTFASGPDMPFGNGSSQEYGVVADRQCKSYGRAAFFAYFTGPTQSRSFAPGKMTRLYAVTHYINTLDVGPGGGGTIVTKVGNKFCHGYAEFTPAAGHTYEAALDEKAGRTCELHVIDAATGKPPEDLAVVNDMICPGRP